MKGAGEGTWYATAVGAQRPVGKMFTFFRGAGETARLVMCQRGAFGGVGETAGNGAVDEGSAGTSIGRFVVSLVVA